MFVLGLVAIGLEKLGLGLGRLPGDIRIERERGGFYFPIVTSILLSIIATLLLNLWTKR